MPGKAVRQGPVEATGRVFRLWLRSRLRSGCSRSATQTGPRRPPPGWGITRRRGSGPDRVAIRLLLTADSAAWRESVGACGVLPTSMQLWLQRRLRAGCSRSATQTGPRRPPPGWGITRRRGSGPDRVAIRLLRTADSAARREPVGACGVLPTSMQLWLQTRLRSGCSRSATQTGPRRPPPGWGITRRRGSGPDRVAIRLLRTADSAAWCESVGACGVLPTSMQLWLQRRLRAGCSRSATQTGPRRPPPGWGITRRRGSGPDRVAIRLLLTGDSAARREPVGCYREPVGCYLPACSCGCRHGSVPDAAGLRRRPDLVGLHPGGASPAAGARVRIASRSSCS